MLTKKSRYQNALGFTPRADGAEVFPGIRARAIRDATGVIEHAAQAGDRLDQLARHYYNDDRLWWRIVDANPDVTFGFDLLGDAAVGTVILIPKAKE
jgi:nucleoid-associated protein YgaU